MHRTWFAVVAACFLIAHPARAILIETTNADLLIVGGTEAGVAAALQAARLGVKNIVLVNDIHWLGGQFSAEAVGAIDEWTIVKGKRVNFPRSGLFLEVMQKIREHNGLSYGTPTPGNAVTASDTIEPAAAADIFKKLLEPYEGRQIQVLRNYRPIHVIAHDKKVLGVTFEQTNDAFKKIHVNAALTIDASDWGDVVRLSGAKYMAGPDLKSQFKEPSAPNGPLGAECNEMNPITYCMVLRPAKEPGIISKPLDYDERKYYCMTGQTAVEFAKVGYPKGTWSIGSPIFVDSAYPEGMYSSNQSAYTQRRLVDQFHNRLKPGTECVLFNWPVQDYPLYDFPKRVNDLLEASEAGASKKNIVDMTPAQRQIVFDDAKRQSLGMLYFLQTYAHGKAGKMPLDFRQLQLTDEFGTPDQMPPKPYVREGLRLQALYMLREQDIRTPSDNPRWAKVMVPDAVFGFQFNIDFHPTRRQFLNNDPTGPWGLIHTQNRNWSTHTDRAMFPVRGLVPVEMDGLLGCSKNIGLTSIASSALRLHGQMMMVGQAAGTVAYLALRDEVKPRDVARDWRKIRELQHRLVKAPQGKPGVLLWPYHDLSPDDAHFEAANMLTVRGIVQADADSLDFQPWRPVTHEELEACVHRVLLSLGREPAAAPDKADGSATWKTLYDRLKAANLPASPGLQGRGKTPLYRADLAIHLWHALQGGTEILPDDPKYLQPGYDADGDGIADVDDPLPFDRNNNNVWDRLEPRR